MTTSSSSSDERIETEAPSGSSSSNTMTVLKTLAACAFFYSAVTTHNAPSATTGSTTASSDAGFPRRQLSMVADETPSYMEGLVEDLKGRKKLFDETPPEEVKYWFEYTGPLQVGFEKCENAVANCLILVSFRKRV